MARSETTASHSSKRSRWLIESNAQRTTSNVSPRSTVVMSAWTEARAGQLLAGDGEHRVRRSIPVTS